MQSGVYAGTTIARERAEVLIFPSHYPISIRTRVIRMLADNRLVDVKMDSSEILPVCFF